MRNMQWIFVQDLLESLERIFRFGLDLTAGDIAPGESFNKECYSVKSIAIPSTNEDLTQQQSSVESEEDHHKLNSLVGSIFPTIVHKNLPPKILTSISLPKSIKNPGISANFILTGTPTRGKFIVEKAK